MKLRYLPVFLFFFGISSTLSSQEAERNLLIDSVVKYYASIKALPGLEVEYRMDREVLELTSSEIWAWSWGKFTNAIRPSIASKIFVRVVLPAYNENLKEKKAEPNSESIGTLDDGIWVDFNKDVESGRSSAMITTIDKHPVYSQVVMHCYYFHFLGFPVSPDPESGVALRRRYQKRAYWLPEALSQNRQMYTLTETKATFYGESCRILERPGIDKIWVGESTRRVLRRQFYWEAENLIRQDVRYTDFQDIDSSKLAIPKQIVFEQYAAPWDETKIKGKMVSRLTLQVTSISTKPLPDERFRPEIPAGTEILDFLHSGTDITRGIRYTNKPGNNPFEESIWRLIDQPSTYVWFFVVLVCALVLAILVRLYYPRIRKFFAAK